MLCFPHSGIPAAKLTISLAKYELIAYKHDDFTHTFGVTLPSTGLRLSPYVCQGAGGPTDVTSLQVTAFRCAQSR